MIEQINLVKVTITNSVIETGDEKGGWVYVDTVLGQHLNIPCLPLSRKLFCFSNGATESTCASYK